MGQEKALADEKARDQKLHSDTAAKKVQAPSKASWPMISLQRLIGNAAATRAICQRKAEAASQIGDEQEDQIRSETLTGQPLDKSLVSQVSPALGTDMSSVRVHTSSEADSLSRELGAAAFTTGRDIFFRRGAYQPNTSSGQRLIAHELAHVVQQSTGEVPASGSGMTVRPAGDQFEQEADAFASALTAQVQRQEMPEEEEPTSGL